MAAHTKEQKEFIVRKLAAHYSPEDIVAAFRAWFSDTQCDVKDVAACDPRKSIVSPDLFDLFNVEQKSFLDKLNSEAPTSDQRVRLVELHRMFVLYRDSKRYPEARSVLAQIAVEQGIGAKGGKIAAPEAVDPAEEVIAITRTIIDPVKVS